jgi:hypothetical protein
VIPGILGDEWRRFIMAGEEYLKKHAAATYPRADDACAYCQQPLTATAVDLVKRYREFSDNDIKTALDTTERELAAYAKPVSDLKGDALETQFAAETNGAPDILEPVKAVVEQIKKLSFAVAARHAVVWDDKDSKLSAAETVVIEEETRLNARIAGLQSSVEERQAALKAKQKELTELQGKKTAHSLLPQIEKRVTDAKWVARATIVKNNIPNVLRSLTEAAKEASEVLLNKDFGKTFRGGVQAAACTERDAELPGPARASHAPQARIFVQAERGTLRRRAESPGAGGFPRGSHGRPGGVACRVRRPDHEHGLPAHP